MIALDIGGTKLAAARVEEGGIVAKRIAPTPTDSPDQLLAEVYRLSQDWSPSAATVAVACTGVYRDGHIYSVNRQTISAWHGYPLLARLQALFGADKRFVILNDAAAACWGEYCQRAAAPPNMIYLTVSTGVGGGLIVNGRLLTSPTGLAGHVGHTTIATAGAAPAPLCGCGRRGCAEAIASGTAIGQQASAVLGRTVSAQEVFALAYEYAECDAIIQRSAEAIGQLLVNLKMIFDSELAVIGGGVGLAPGYIDRICASLAVLPSEYRVEIAPAVLGADSGLLGVAGWARVV